MTNKKIFALLLLICLIFIPVFSLFSQEGKSEKKNNNNNSTEKKDEEFAHNLKVRILNYVIKRNFPRKFNFDVMNIDVLSGLGVEFHNLMISENKNFGDDEFLATGYVGIKMKMLPLFIGNMNIIEMIIKEPRITMIRNSKGELSFVDLLKTAEKKKAMIDWVEISKFSFSKAKITFIDEAVSNGTAIMNMDSFNIQMNDFSLDKICRIKMEGHIPGGDKINFAMSGEIGPLKNKLNLNQIPVDVRMSMENISLAPYMHYVPIGIPFGPFSGTSSMYFKIKGSMASTVFVSGNMVFNDLVMENHFDKTLSSKVSMSINMPDGTTYKPEAGVFASDSMDVFFNGHKFVVKGKVTGLYNKPKWDIVIQTKNFYYKDLFSIYPQFNKYFNQNFSFYGMTDLEIQSNGDLDQMSGIMNVDMNQAGFVFLDLMEKRKSVPARIKINGDKDYKNNIYADCTFTFGELVILKKELIYKMLDDIFCDLLTIQKISNNSGTRKEIQDYLARLRKIDTLRLENVTGLSTIISNGLNWDMMRVSEMKMSGIDGMELIVNGIIDYKNETMDIKSKIFLSKEFSKSLVSANAVMKSMRNPEGRVMLPVTVSGSSSGPKVSLDSKYVIKIIESGSML